MSDVDIHELARMPGFGRAKAELKKAGLWKFGPEDAKHFDVTVEIVRVEDIELLVAAPTKERAMEVAHESVREGEGAGADEVCPTYANEVTNTRREPDVDGPDAGARAMTRPAPTPASDDEPLTLAEAAEQCLGGRVSPRTLREAARRGELVVERLGRTVLVTPAEIRRWREACRSDRKAPGYGSAPRPEAGEPSGSSRTGHTEKARDAALTILSAPNGR